MRTLLLLGQGSWAATMLENTAACTELPAGVHALKSAAEISRYPGEIVLLGDAYESPAYLAGVEKLNGQPALCIAGVNQALILAACAFLNSLDTLEELQNTLLAEGAAGVKAFVNASERN